MNSSRLVLLICSCLGGSLIQASIDVAQKSGCSCIEYNCGCCAFADVPEIHLNDTVCVNVSYLVKDVGVGLTLTIDGYTLLNETVSVRNPPPICVGVPHLKEYASVCIDLYNLDWSNSTMSGCVALEARLYHIIKAKIPLGCFKLGNKGFPVEHQERTTFINDIVKLREAKKQALAKLGQKYADLFGWK